MELVRTLISGRRDDAGGTRQTWFLWHEQLKNFRSNRRGLAKVVAQIGNGTFGDVYRRSPLETVVGSMADQRQILEGADHAFLWKPKLRIPGISENRDNQLAFGGPLRTCHFCTSEADVLRSIHSLEAPSIQHYAESQS